MHFGRMALALTLSLGLTVAAVAAPAGIKSVVPSRSKPHHEHLRGKVVAVQNKANGGEIQVKVRHHHHKKNAKTAAAAATSKKKHQGVVTVHVTDTTKFARVIHNQGRVHRSAATFADVRKGEHVHVVASGTHHHAREVNIVVHQHSKKLPPAKKPPKKKAALK